MAKKEGKVIRQSKAARLPKGKPPVVGQVTVARITLRSQDMANWQAAINQARNELMPRRRALYELYDNLVLDAHLHAVLSKRTTNVTNKRVEWVQEGASDELLDRIYSDIIDTPWFHDFLTHAMSVVAYGPTVIELVPEEGLISRCEVVPRANVVPERGYIAEDALNPDRPLIYYREDPVYSTYLIEVGKPKDLGALVIALPYLLWKRDGFADFAQFAELFGMPFRTGTYNPYDEGTRDKLNQALSQMGGAGYAVIPEGANVQFHNAGGSSGNQGSVFKDLVELCNAELSKLFLGNTLTTEQGDKGARSLGEVHQGVEDDIAMSDMRRIEHLLNWELKDRLARLGYPVQDGYFRFDLSVGLPVSERIKVDTLVAEHVEVPESYWRDTYGIPAPNASEKKAGKEAKDKPAPGTGEPEGEDDETDRGTTARLRRELAMLYRPHHHGHSHGFKAAGEPGGGSDAILEELAKAIHDGRITEGWVDPKLMQWTADELMKGVLGGFEGGDQATAESVQLQTMMQRNVMVFSGFKTYQTLRTATDELMDADGQFRPFSEFKARILAIDKEYNVDYLRAEYQHAVASGQMAERWLELQRDKDVFPYLRYSTAGDDRVRPDHDALDGVVKPVDDAFWDTNYPPNGWGCRCDVEQVASDEGGKQLPASYSDQRQGMFRSNVGKDGVVFPKSHPYYQVESKAKDRVEKEVNDAADRLLVSGPRITPDTKPQGPAVSAALDIKVTGQLRTQVDDAISLIDAVHGDGVLARIPLLSGKLSKGVYARYLPDWQSNVAIDITVTRTKHSINSVLHEVGHWLDHIGLGKGNWATERQSKEMKALLKAMEKTEAVKSLRSILDKGSVTMRNGNEVDLLYSQMERIDQYLLHPRELFARGYNQYIVTKTGRTDLQDLLKVWDDTLTFGGVIREQWTPQDFEPLMAKFDALFMKQGWLTK